MADENSTAASTQSVNFRTCPICKHEYSSTLALRRHIGTCHRDVTLAQLNIHGNYFHECRSCHQFFCGRRGLNLHYQRSQCDAPCEQEQLLHPVDQHQLQAQQQIQQRPLQQLPQQQQQPQPQPRQYYSEFLTMHGLTLSDLVSSHSQGLYYLRKTWRDKFTRTAIRLIDRICATPPLEELHAHEATAAFLLLPGLIRTKQIHSHNISSFFDDLLTSDDTDLSARVLQVAAELYRPIHQRQDQHQRSKRQVKRSIEGLVDIGRFGTALARCEDLNRLYSDNPATTPPLSTQQQRQAIESLHPPASVLDEIQPLSSRLPTVVITADEVSYGLSTLKSSSARGWSGWTNRVISGLAFTGEHAETFRESVLSLAHAFVNNLLPRRMYDLFMVCRTVLLPKDAGGWRPLGIGEAWYRLFARILCRKFVPSVLPQMQPLQMGCGTAGGSEICARLAMLAYSHDAVAGDDCAIASLDIKNAFNSIRRSLILTGIRRFCPSLERWFWAAYGSYSDLRTSDGTLVGQSQTGVRQGDPLSSLCFCVAFHAVLERIQLCLLDAVNASNTPISPALCWAYADDITICAPAAILQTVCTQLPEIFAEFDLQLVPEKCAMLGRAISDIERPVFPVAAEGIKKIMGCPVGSNEFCLAELQRSLDTMLTPLPYLRRIHPQSAFLLLTRCVNARASYVATTVDVPGARRLLQEFDNQVSAAIAEIAGCQLTPLTCSIIQLPRGNGGLGVRAHGGFTGDIHRIESRQRTIDFITRYLPSFLPSVSAWPQLPLAQRVHDDQDPRSIVKADHNETMLLLQGFLSAGDGLRLAQGAWFRSSCYGGSGRWLDWRGDVCRRFRFGRQAYVDALRMRLLIPCGRLPFAPAHRCRTRVVDMNAEPFHLLDCSSNQFWFHKRHNKVRDLLAQYISSCWVDADVQCEVGLHHTDGSICRADLVVQRGQVSYVIDVAITNPGSRSAVQAGSGHRSDSAAGDRERFKRAMYSDVQELSEDVSFVPFVLEATGRMGPAARAFLDRVTEDNSSSLSHFLSCTSAVVTLHNAWMLAGTRTRIMRHAVHAEAG